MGKGQLDQLAYGARLAGSDHIIVGLVLLQHAPHRLDVIAGESPVPPRVQIAHPQLGREAALYSGDGVSDLSRDELEAATRALVIEQDAGYREQVEALAVIYRDVVAIHLCNPIRAARVEWRLFGLRCLADLAEHLARACLVEPDPAVHAADRL